MPGSSIELSQRSLQGNVVLTTLRIAAVDIGVGGSMTALRIKAADLIAEKSSRIFTAQKRAVRAFGIRRYTDIR